MKPVTLETLGFILQVTPATLLTRGTLLTHYTSPTQVSDIHISSFRNYDIVPDFKGFIATSLAAIAPKVVMVTGDLTDAKSKSKFMKYRFKRILNLIFSITLTGYSGH